MCAQRLPILAIVNPRAGEGRCGKRAPAALATLRAAGLEIETRETTAPREATAIAREAFAGGTRSFIAGGGDGTSFEVLNGFLPPALAAGETVRLGFLPLGTGNSLLRDFASKIADHAVESLIAGRRRPCDALRLRYRGGAHYFINLCGFGMVADTSKRAIRYKRWGALSYTLAGLGTIAAASFPELPMRVDGGELVVGPSAMLCVCNSRYAAQMIMAPDADVADGFADLIHAEPMSRLQMVRAFPALLDGSHVRHPLIRASQVREIRFEVDREVDVMIDGEILRLVPESIEVLPQALEICV